MSLAEFDSAVFTTQQNIISAAKDRQAEVAQGLKVERQLVGEIAQRDWRTDSAHRAATARKPPQAASTHDRQIEEVAVVVLGIQFAARNSELYGEYDWPAFALFAQQQAGANSGSFERA